VYLSNDLIDDAKNQKLMLFAGAGVSMNLGLPSWSSLIDQMALELGFTPEAFKKLGSFLELAEYYQLKKGSIGPLRSWMDTKFHSSNINIADSAIHKHIVDLNFPQIYTTNYDRWLEKAHEFYKKPYDKITGIHDFTLTHRDTTQIIKYHGDFDDDASIVFTETSYFKRLGLDTALDMKLRADAFGKSLLFVGYSLSDIDIRFLLYKLQLLWGTGLETSIQPKSYILLTTQNPIQQKILESRNIETITSDEQDPGKALESFLASLAEKANPKN
jgi:hypothetical protein